VPRFLDSILDFNDFLETPISLGRIFRRPRQMAIVLALGIALAGIADYRRHAVVLRSADGAHEVATSVRHAFV